MKRSEKNNVKKIKKSKLNRQYRKPEIQEVEFTVKADPGYAYGPY